jgi:ABC-2 type transport system ATP-binding protein
MIRTDKLCKRFRRIHALRDAALTVEAGSATALIGANGSGKSTLIRVLMNLLPPDRGSATVLGVDSRRLSYRELGRIGYAAESQEMPARLTTGEYIAYLRTFYPAWDRSLETEIVRHIRLPMDTRIDGLSHGMRMKMAIVCALSFRPELLILDEPLSGLDPLVRDDLLETLVGQAGDTTILISSQELGEIENLCTHVAMIEEGRVLFQESMDTLRSRFREVRVTFAGEARCPSRPPAEWLRVQAAGNVLSFVETRFSEDGLSERVCAGSGEAPAEVRRIEAQAMPLRAIFTTLARAGREGSGS